MVYDMYQHVGTYHTQNFFRALFNIYSFYLFVLIHKSENISKLYVLYDNEKLLKHYRVASLHRLMARIKISRKENSLRENAKILSVTLPLHFFHTIEGNLPKNFTECDGFIFVAGNFFP